MTSFEPFHIWFLKRTARRILDKILETDLVQEENDYEAALLIIDRLTEECLYDWNQKDDKSHL